MQANADNQAGRMWEASALPLYAVNRVRIINNNHLVERNYESTHHQEGRHDEHHQ